MVYEDEYRTAEVEMHPSIMVFSWGL